MAGKDSNVTAGVAAGAPSNEIESTGSSFRTTRNRRGGGGGGGGAPSPTPLSTSSSGRISTRLRTLASSPTPFADSLSDGGAAAAAAAGDIGVGRRGRRSGRNMALPVPTKSDNNDINIEMMDEENEFVDDFEISSRATTMMKKTKKKKRKRSSLLLSKEKEGEETVITKSTIDTTIPSEDHETEPDATNAIKNQCKSSDIDKRRPLVLLGEKPRGTYECDYCGSDITRTPRIRCADCPDFDLCLECFACADHHYMVKYKRDEEAQRRKDAAKSAGLDLTDVELMKAPSSSSSTVGEGRRGGRLVGSKNAGNGEDEELGSYVGGIWVPYFRHTPHHRYIVADSTRYVMFPSFRGVRAVVAEGVDISKSNDNASADTGTGTGAATETGDVTTDKSLKVIEENEALAPSIGNEPITTSENQCERHPTELSNTAMSIDAAACEDENAMAEMSAEEDFRETETQKNIDGAKSNACNESNERTDTFHDNIPEASEEENGETILINDQLVTLKKDDEEAPPLSDDSQKADITDNKTTDNSCSIVAHEPEYQPQTYIVTDDAKSSWMAEEDLRLLDGILSCGLGNWPDIAEHVNGTNNGDGGGSNGVANGEGGSSWIKTDKQCMERYLDDFMGRYGYILPPYTMVPEPQGECGGDAKLQAAGVLMLDNSDDGESSGTDTAARKRPRRSASSSLLGGDDWAPGFKSIKFRATPTETLGDNSGLWPHPYIPPIEGVRMGNEVGRDLWYRSEQYFIRQMASTSNPDEAEAFRKEFIERRAKNLPGYEAKVLPPRLEDMKQLPGAELAGYMPRRGEFDMEWDNDAEKTISEMEFTSDDTEADRELKLEVLRIFNAKLEEREKRKRFIIDRGLINYRENQEKLWQMAPDERQLVQRMRIFARYQTREEHDAFVAKIIEAKRLRKEISKLQMYRRMGIISLADAEKYEMDKTRRELHRSAWMKKEEEKRKAAEEATRVAKEQATSLGIAPPASVPATSSQPQEASHADTNQSLQVWRQFKRSKKDSRSESEAEVKDDKFILKDKPGYELLTKKEAELCKRLLLLPQNYLDVKKALISESIAQGIWDPTEGCLQNKNKSIFKVDVTQRDNVIDFVLASGWIPTRPSLQSAVK